MGSSLGSMPAGRPPCMQGLGRQSPIQPELGVKVPAGHSTLCVGGGEADGEVVSRLAHSKHRRTIQLQGQCHRLRSQQHKGRKQCCLQQQRCQLGMHDKLSAH